MAPGKNQRKLDEVVKTIASVIALMIAVFTLLAICFPPNLTQPIGALIIGLIITAILVWMRKVRPGWALATWLTAGIGLIIGLMIILYLIVSRPTTVVGSVVDNSGSPIRGLTLILTDANGVDHKAVTNQDGAFEIKNVPEGRFTISTNGEFIYSGQVSSDLRHIDSQKDIGTVYKSSPSVIPGPTVVAVVIPDTPTPMPTVPTDTPSPLPTQVRVSPTPTHTPIPSTDTPMPKSTPTNALTPTPTNTPVTPTDTPTLEPPPTNTPKPTPFYCTKSGNGDTENIKIEPPDTISGIRIDLEERGTKYGFSLLEVRIYSPDIGGTNLAIGGEADASSVQDDDFCIKKECTFAAAKAVDGDMNTRWSSDWLDEQWFKVTLSKPQVVGHIELRWEAAFARKYCVTLLE
jgi:hypothetical protein